MPNELYIYTTPIGATVVVKPDLDPPFTAEPSSDTGRADEQRIQFPESLARQGADLTVSATDYDPFSGRGLLQPKQVCPSCGTVVASEAFFGFNDVHLKPTAKPPEPPVPPTPSGNTPLEIINAVYATGQYNLALKGQGGCGEFTEECARQLAVKFGPQWGHVAKSPGQNQYGNHAVDAIYALAGSDVGVWDIIQNSVSTSAKPVFNDAGPGEPDEWRPADPVPVQPMTSRRAVAIHVSVNATLWDDFLAALKRDPGDR